MKITIYLCGILVASQLILPTSTADAKYRKREERSIQWNINNTAEKYEQKTVEHKQMSFRIDQPEANQTPMLNNANQLENNQTQMLNNANQLAANQKQMLNNANQFAANQTQMLNNANQLGSNLETVMNKDKCVDSLDSDISCTDDTCSGPRQFTLEKTCDDGKTCCCTDANPCLCMENCRTDLDIGHGSCCNESKTCCYPCNYNQSLYDVAKGKTAEQGSSRRDTFAVYGADRALDGNNNTFTHTLNDKNPFWRVDLNQTYKIGRVEVLYRLEHSETK